MDSLSSIQHFLSQHQDTNTTADMFAATPIPSVKVEEASASTITPDLLSLPAASEASTSDSKSVKKRKSWGQVLPEPKTSLPPRKRAKTADEKEQRRIERVKRNRLAAHNSRERKREEMDKLADQNSLLLAQMAQMQRHIAALQDELKQFRSGKTPSVSSFDFSSVATISTSPAMTATDASTSLTSLTTPELGNLDSPMSNVEDFSQPATPAPEQDQSEAQALVEPTQQSAVLLCDLQCRSTRPASPSPSSPASKPQNPPSPTSNPLMAMTGLLTFWLNLQLFLSNCSTLSSILSQNIPHTLQLLSLPPTALPTIMSSPRLRGLLTLTYSMTMLARLPTSSASSPTQAHLTLVATSLASALRMEISRSSSSSMRLAPRAQRRGGRLDPGEIGMRDSLRDRDARRRCRRTKRELHGACSRVLEDSRSSRRRALRRIMEQKILSRGIRR